MILVLLIVVPCCLVGVVVYAAMSRWELSAGPEAYRSGGGTGGYRQPGPRLTLRETAMDWPIPQLQRLHPGVLIAISAVLALWILAWIVLFFVGLGMLHA
ncbi:MAG: hypothetical protein QOG43_899 [Actinomycetota bacterium]|nr:hypothetical protein [Actinomycetota bacterium]